MLNKLVHLMRKAYTGELGNGVSLEKEKQNRSKGTALELEVVSKLEEKGYFVLHNSYFLLKNNKTLEVDVLAVSEQGVFVIEVKNYKGCSVHVNTTDKEWVVTYNNNKVFPLYNPVMQNATKVRYIKGLLETGIPVYSVVVFADSDICNLIGQKATSDVVVLNINQLEKYLNTRRGILKEVQVKRTFKTIKGARYLGLFKGVKHVRNVNKR